MCYIARIYFYVYFYAKCCTLQDLVVEHTALVQSDFLHQESEFEQKLMEFINQIVVEYTEYINENKQILGKIFDVSASYQIFN